MLNKTASPKPKLSGYLITVALHSNQSLQEVMTWISLLTGAFDMDVFKNGTTTVLQLASKLLNLFSYTGLVCEHMGYEKLIKVHFIRSIMYTSAAFARKNIPRLSREFF